VEPVHDRRKPDKDQATLGAGNPGGKLALSLYGQEQLRLKRGNRAGQGRGGESQEVTSDPLGKKYKKNRVRKTRRDHPGWSQKGKGEQKETEGKGKVDKNRARGGGEAI